MAADEDKQQIIVYAATCQPLALSVAQAPMAASDMPLASHYIRGIQRLQKNLATIARRIEFGTARIVGIASVGSCELRCQSQASGSFIARQWRATFLTDDSHSHNIGNRVSADVGIAHLHPRGMQAAAKISSQIALRRKEQNGRQRQQ